MSKSFFRKMVEEKGLIDEVIVLNGEGGVFGEMEVEFLVKQIEQANPLDKQKIKRDFSIIDYKNGDLYKYLQFLAKIYIRNQYEHVIN